MTDTDLERIRNFLDGRIEPDELEKLNQLLENDPEARVRFRAMATLEEGLRDLAEIPAILPPAVEKNAASRERTSFSMVSALFHRPAFAAAAGLMIGVFGTTAIWAASESGRQKILTLLHESFEFGPSPRVTGIPMEPEVWSGDYTEVVSEYRGIAPKHGRRMLRILRADHEGKENAVGYIGDVYRVIDLRAYESTLAHDDAVVSVESAIGSVPFEDPNRFVCGIAVYALGTLPSGRAEWKALLEPEGNLTEESLATARRWITLSPGGGTWERAQLELRLPQESRYLVVAVHVSDRRAIQPSGEPPAVEFSGQFLDDVRVVLSRRASEF